MASKEKKRTKKKPKLTRKTADRHLLYQWSVQNPEFEVGFMDKVYKRLNKSRPLVLREDFCGTALAAKEWVESHPERQAIGLDLDEETLEWGRKNNVDNLGPHASRVDLRLEDVRTTTTPLADVVCALNFSYYLFSEFRELVSYFRHVRQSLKPGGIVFLDTYGGWESQQVKVEPRKVEGPEGNFTYIWDQAEYNPVDNMALCHIHFKFPDGKKWKKAFTYHWRLYTPAEVRDALLEAGFRHVESLWDHEDDSEEDDDYRRTRKIANAPAWITYVVGQV
jgi:SAM-dependent methyltransferase